MDVFVLVTVYDLKSMEHAKKKKSRDPARQSRGQQNDQLSEIATPLPLSLTDATVYDSKSMDHTKKKKSRDAARQRRGQTK